MIDLTRTREELLAEIGAPHPPNAASLDILDPRIAAGDVQVRVDSHRRRNLFALLRLALMDRFAAVPRAELLRDVLIPLKHALGNAYKHGNGKDPDKVIRAEIVLARNGAVIAITDEGPGFDVDSTFQRFHEQQAYFVNHGWGFRKIHAAKSTVSYEHGGRTLVLCYRPSGDGQTADPADRRAPPEVLDPEWIRICLSDECPELGDSSAHGFYRVYPAPGDAAGECGCRCVLRSAGDDTRVLTGTLHATADAAQADFEAATQLYEARITKRIRVPRPVARLKREPRLVFYDFDAWMTLREYLIYRGSLRSVRNSSDRIGHLLAAVHRSQIEAPGRASSTDDGLEPRIARAETALRSVASESPVVDRFRRCVERYKEQSESWKEPVVAPIHGGLTWDAVRYGVDGNFYLYRFENCRRGDPAVDLGGFAADLLCFTLAHHDGEAYRTCRDDFLRRYNLEAVRRVSADDIHVYALLALCERLQATNHHWRREPLLATLNAACEFELEQV